MTLPVRLYESDDNVIDELNKIITKGDEQKHDNMKIHYNREENLEEGRL